MACLDMYNSDHKPGAGAPPPTASPRISFSNDFIDPHSQNQHREKVAVGASTDFEFSVSNHSMMSADQLFFKGRILPFKDSNFKGQIQRTMRDELLVDDDDDDDDGGGNGEFTLKPSKNNSCNKWKGFLGLRKSHIGSRKLPEKNEGFLLGSGACSISDDANGSAISFDDSLSTKSPQGDEVSSTTTTSTANMQMGM